MAMSNSNQEIQILDGAKARLSSARDSMNFCSPASPKNEPVENFNSFCDKNQNILGEDLYQKLRTAGEHIYKIKHLRITYDINRDAGKSVDFPADESESEENKLLKIIDEIEVIIDNRKNAISDS